MSLLETDDLKEQQKINELERKIKREKAKRDKKLTHQKIVLGAFFLDILEKNQVTGLREYTVNNLDGFLTRKTDKENFEAFIKTLKSKTEQTDVNVNDFNSH